MNDVTRGNFTYRDDTKSIHYMNKIQVCSVVQDVDGYHKVYGFGDGLCDAWILKGIANLLEEINAEWDAEIERFFGQEKEQ